MVSTWMGALKEYLSPDVATNDWAFAWQFERNSDIVKIFEALKTPVSHIMKQALIGKVSRCFTSLAIALVDNITDYVLAAEYFRLGDSKMAALTMFWPLLSNLVQTIFSIGK